jgi:ketosteroid isomerase-like protein
MENVQEQLAIEKLIFSFRDAFNAADISKTVASFTPDGINMPNNAPAAKGEKELMKAFGFLFNMAEINIQYVIDEIIVNGNYAFARTISKVTTVIKTSRDQIFLENKEIFVLYNDGADWKISHYIFNNTKTTNNL